MKCYYSYSTLLTLVGLLLASPILAQAPESNKEIVLRMTEAINEWDFAALDDLVPEDIVRHSAATPGVVVSNLEEFKAFLNQDLAAVPDAQQEIHLILAESDLVAVRAIYRGTQTGPMGPFGPSGKPLELPFLGILRLEDGKIAEIWVEWDNLNALTQLGHFPPTEGDPEEMD
jgi:predicted ester cyclase